MFAKGYMGRNEMLALFITVDSIKGAGLFDRFLGWESNRFYIHVDALLIQGVESSDNRFHPTLFVKPFSTLSRQTNY